MLDRYNVIDEAELAAMAKHEAFRARFEFCNFQPQQFLGP